MPKRRVAIIFPDRSRRCTYETILQSYGYEVETFLPRSLDPDAEDVVELSRFDIILCNLGDPGGLTVPISDDHTAQMAIEFMDAQDVRIPLAVTTLTRLRSKEQVLEDYGGRIDILFDWSDYYQREERGDVFDWILERWPPEKEGQSVLPI